MSECGKIRTIIIPNTDTFHAVKTREIKTLIRSPLAKFIVHGTGNHAITRTNYVTGTLNNFFRTTLQCLEKYHDGLLTPFWPANVPFWYPLKTSQNLWRFQVAQKWNIHLKGVKYLHNISETMESNSKKYLSIGV